MLVFMTTLSHQVSLTQCGETKCSKVYFNHYIY